jgi:hypothetical protein
MKNEILAATPTLDVRLVRFCSTVLIRASARSPTILS